MSNPDVTASDIELVLLGIIAFWGDGKISKKERDVLETGYFQRQQKLNLVALTDPEDADFSKKEYLVGLFDFLNEEERRISNLDEIELPTDFATFNKKKLKKTVLSVKQKVFVLLLDDLGTLYDEEHEQYKRSKKDKSNKEKTLEVVSDRSSRMKLLYRELNSIAKADGNISKEEKDIIDLTKYEYHTRKWVLGLGAVVLLLTIAYCSI